MKSLDFLFWWEGHFERGYGKSLGPSESNLLLIWQNSTKMLNFIWKGFGSVFKKKSNFVSLDFRAENGVIRAYKSF